MPDPDTALTAPAAILAGAVRFGGRACAALLVSLAGGLLSTAQAQVPPLLHHQGRLAVGEALFDGPGQFKFALVGPGVALPAWGNSPDGDADGVPDAAVTLPVSRGLYSVLLGDTSVDQMAPLSPTIFAQPELYLRVWFDDGVHGFERLEPDQRLASVGYAMVAATVPDGSVTAAKLASGTLDGLAAQIAVLTAELHALSNRHESLVGSISASLPPGVPLVSSLPADPTLISAGFSMFLGAPAPGWTAGATAGAPLPRYDHTGVWTGQSLLVWGGVLGSGSPSSAGAAYEAAQDQWSPLPDADAPAPRRGHTAVWSGDAMLIWGGFGAGYLRSGGEFAPASPLWRELPIQGAPAGREGHVGVWTGSRMLIWGGRDAAGLLGDGGLYDPVGRVWSGLPEAGAPEARVEAAAAWAGSRFLVWGGLGVNGELASGGILAFTGGSTPGAWVPMTSVGSPTPRSGHTAVWTGQRLLIWGGQAGGALLGDGAAFDPAANSWQALPSTGAPTPRSGHLAVWTGTEMLVFGGETAGGTTATGAAYDPVTGTWRSLSMNGGPLARSGAEGAWSGSGLIVFGGRSSGSPLAALQRLNPQPDVYFYRKP